MANISCVICAYNEASRIRGVLDVVEAHPLFDEVIVVDDGSTDGTDEVLHAYPTLRVIRYAANRGKTYALSEGIAAARNGLIMLLDADLTGLTAENLDALAKPVLACEAEVSISLRRNSLALYRFLGMDFVSGERVIPKSLLVHALFEMKQLPRWGGEVFMNRLIVAGKLRVAVVRWANVSNVRKCEKVGVWNGAMQDIRMIWDVLRVISPLQAVIQTIGLLVLTLPVRARRALPAPD
jgi:glycosyltransferase involved in cell wall biosynthesis